VAELHKNGALVIEKDIARSPEHARAVSGEDAALRDRLEEIYREAKLAAPSISEALSRVGLTASQHTTWAQGHSGVDRFRSVSPR
jgi:hypothetical protein